MSTILLLPNLVGFELDPCPIDYLVGEDGAEKYFRNGAAEAFVEAHLILLVKTKAVLLSK